MLVSKIERYYIAQLYGYHAEYRCNWCKFPIFLHMIPVITRRGHYHPHCWRRKMGRSPGDWDGTLWPKEKQDIRYKGLKRKIRQARKRKRKEKERRRRQRQLQRALAKRKRKQKG